TAPAARRPHTTPPPDAPPSQGRAASCRQRQRHTRLPPIPSRQEPAARPPASPEPPRTLPCRPSPSPRPTSPSPRPLPPPARQRPATRPARAPRPPSTAPLSAVTFSPAALPVSSSLATACAAALHGFDPELDPEPEPVSELEPAEPPTEPVPAALATRQSLA